MCSTWARASDRPHAQIGQHATGGSLLVPDQREQQVLRPDRAVVEPLRLLEREAQHVARAVREHGERAAGSSEGRADHAARPCEGRAEAPGPHRHRVEIDRGPCDDVRGHLQQPEHDVGRRDLVGPRCAA